MKTINQIIAFIKRNNAIRELNNKLEFYPSLTMYNAGEFTFDEINEILNIKHELKQL